MAIKEITYDDKVDLQLWGNVSDVNKIKADDMNEIKNTVNNNAKELILNEDNQIHIETEQSSTINVQDASGQNAKINVFGNSIQNGEPTPKAPVNIENVTGNIDITDCNKNLFDGIFEEGTIDAEGNLVTTSNVIRTKNFIKANGLISISYENALDIAVYAYDINKNFIAVVDKQTTTSLGLEKASSYNLPQTTKYIKFRFNSGYINLTTKAQVEKSNIATDYIEHEEQIKTFPLKEGQKMYEGSYLSDDGIHHVRKQIELDGTENWFIGSIPSLRYPIRLELQDIKLKTTNLITEILSNCFLPDGSSENSTGYENKFTFRQANGSRNLWFFIPKNFFTTTTSTKILEEWKVYLSAQKIAGTPVTIEYPLAEETIEPYTPDQQEAYNQLQNAKTYKTVTNVFTDKALLEFKYIADTKTWVLNEIKPLKEQINTINELLSTANTSAMLLDNLQTDLESEVL